MSLRAATGGVLASLALLSPLAPSPRAHAAPFEPTGGEAPTAFALAADTTPPSPGTVEDGLGLDRDEQEATADMNTSWSGFSDPEWPRLEYALAFGTRPCGTEVRGFQSVGSVLSYTTSGLRLTRGQRYYATVRALNGAGLSTYVSSDGVLVLLEDGGTGDAPGAVPGGVCTPDLPPSDAGTPDSGTPDGGADGGTPDGGAPGGGTLDDEGQEGELEPVLGWGCGASGGSGGLALLALSALGLGVSRRRAPLPRR